MTTSSEIPLSTQILILAGSKVGISVEIFDPEYKYLVRLSNGSRDVIVNSITPSINPLFAGALARDKAYTYFLLKKIGVKVPRGDIWFNELAFRDSQFLKNKGVSEAIAYAGQLANELGFPLIIKPVHQTRSKGVSLAYDLDQVSKAINRIFFELNLGETSLLIQEFIRGQEYRIVTLEDEIILCYKRGDLSALSHPPIPLEALPPDYSRWARKITRILGLDFAGIDFICNSLSEPASATVLEVNGNPSMVALHNQPGRDAMVDLYGKLLLRIFAMSELQSSGYSINS